MAARTQACSGPCGARRIPMPSVRLMCACRSVCGHLLMVRRNSCASAMLNGQNTRLPVWRCICAVACMHKCWCPQLDQHVPYWWELKKNKSVKHCECTRLLTNGVHLRCGLHQQSVSHSEQGTHRGITASWWPIKKGMPLIKKYVAICEVQLTSVTAYQIYEGQLAYTCAYMRHYSQACFRIEPSNKIRWSLGLDQHGARSTCWYHAGSCRDFGSSSAGTWQANLIKTISIYMLQQAYTHWISPGILPEILETRISILHNF